MHTTEHYILEIWIDRGEWQTETLQNYWQEIDVYDTLDEAMEAFNGLHSPNPSEWRIVHRMQSDRVVRQAKSMMSPPRSTPQASENNLPA